MEYPSTPTVLPKALKHVRQFRFWTPEEQELSLQNTLKKRDLNADIWVFAYASLIWNPSFNYTEERLATLEGYHRSLCVWASVNRGTPEYPGLVFGLDHGGSVKGKVFKLPQEKRLDQLRSLWKREMPSDGYIPTWVTCQTPEGPITALAYIMDRQCHSYIGDLTEDETLEIALHATGCYGPCHEYITQTAKSLNLHEMADPKLNRLSARILETLKQKAA